MPRSSAKAHTHYGGEFTGIEPFLNLFKGLPGGNEVWELFGVRVDQSIDANPYLIVRLTNRAIPKATHREVIIENLWLFEMAGGKLASAQLYADTAAAQSLARN